MVNMKGKYLMKCPKCGNKIGYYSKVDGVCCCKCGNSIISKTDLVNSLNKSYGRTLSDIEVENSLESIYNRVDSYDIKRSINETVKYWAWKNKLSDCSICTLEITFEKVDDTHLNLVLLSTTPGIIIGLHGKTIDELKGLLSMIKGFNDLSIKETVKIV